MEGQNQSDVCRRDSCLLTFLVSLSHRRHRSTPPSPCELCRASWIVCGGRAESSWFRKFKPITTISQQSASRWELRNSGWNLAKECLRWTVRVHELHVPCIVGKTDYRDWKRWVVLGLCWHGVANDVGPWKDVGFFDPIRMQSKFKKLSKSPVY